MRHAFGSIAIVQDINFDHLLDVSPQVPRHLLRVQDFLPGVADWDRICNDYVILMARVAAKSIPALNFVGDVLPQHITGPMSDQLVNKSKVITLPVLFKNEQRYDDVVDILQMYENEIREVYNKAGKDGDDYKVHIGGDQLTRERFSGAKRLRIGAQDGFHAFRHLGPITFEFFHMLMNLLQVIFKQLFKDASEQELGTMKSAACRIQRTNIDPEVRRAYQADRDFTILFVDAYVVEAVLEHFGMEDRHTRPTKNAPPADPTEWRDWVFSEFGKIVRNLVFSENQELEQQEPVVGKLGICLHTIHVVDSVIMLSTKHIYLIHDIDFLIFLV